MGIRFKHKRYKGVKFLYRFLMPSDMLCVIEVINYKTEHAGVTTCDPKDKIASRNKLMDGMTNE